MSTELESAVREKYGSIAKAVSEKAARSGMLRPFLLRVRRPRHLEPVLRRGDEWPAARSRRGIPRLRQPDRAPHPRAGTDGARPRLGRRHRRAALREAGRSDRQGLRRGHDRRDAGARAREPAQGRRNECRVPEGQDRSHSAAGRSVDVVISNCVINLVGRQGRGAARGVPRAEARRPIRGVGRRRSRRRAGRHPPQHGTVGRAASPGPSRRASTPRSCRRPASRTSTSSRGGSTTSTTRARSWRRPASTSTRSRRR